MNDHRCVLMVCIELNLKQHLKTGKFLIRIIFLASVEIPDYLAQLGSQHGGHMLVLKGYCLSRKNM